MSEPEVPGPPDVPARIETSRYVHAPAPEGAAVLRWARAACTRVMWVAGVGFLGYGSWVGRAEVEVIPDRHVVTAFVLLFVWGLAWLIRPRRREIPRELPR